MDPVANEAAGSFFLLRNRLLTGAWPTLLGTKLDGAVVIERGHPSARAIVDSVARILWLGAKFSVLKALGLL